MIRVICVCTGTKYDEWYVDNLKHMIDTYSGIKYDKFEVMRENRYDDERGVFNKLLIFEKFKDGQNIYFDLDILIKGDVNNFLRKDFTLCSAWWRPEYHTPLNSSIMSWQGDNSWIHDEFMKDPEYNLFKYRRGMDQFIYENIKDYKLYEESDGFCSIQTINYEYDYDIYLFNQRGEDMKKKQLLTANNKFEKPWYEKYFKSNI
ncbi:MAG: hypothetical protein CMC40_02015 [Flavobacteriaceae bacterium]|jgi:hypothetical protein|nr:hypothetical protein [Flavobacteriaceae bacterium]|tara:strand:- start:2208 stop:2819 length:612 start_codon:yes stop_codon:yes gene_type:complete